LSKKGDHPLLQRLLLIVDARLPFASEVARIQRQRQWLIELERLLDPEQQPPPTSAIIAQAVDRYLLRLTTSLSHSGDQADQAVATHIAKSFRSFWWGLFTAYDVDGLPRTNNDLERFMRQLKMGQRRISGRSHDHDALIRYGAFLAFLDYQESEAQLLERLLDVSQDEFLKERHSLDMTLLREQKRHRFVHHRQDFLADLEQRWQQAVSNSIS
jgi:hypothetical protein